MDKVGGNVFLVPLGDLLDDDFGLIYPARREQPSWGLRYYPPAGTNLQYIVKGCPTII
jgi:hypothetical protein